MHVYIHLEIGFMSCNIRPLAYIFAVGIYMILQNTTSQRTTGINLPKAD